MKKLIYLFIVLFASIDARLFKGQCRKRLPSDILSFNYKSYLGIWYEIEWYDDEYPTYDECIKFTYIKTKSNAFNMTLDLKDRNNSYTPQRYQGHGIVSQPGLLGLFTPAKLSTTFSPGPPSRVNHQILATDYKRYSFVWDCVNVNKTYYNERMWYFDRQQNATVRPARVKQLILKYFNEQYIRKTYQGAEC